jgi:hypothetical protein
LSLIHVNVDLLFGYEREEFVLDIGWLGCKNPRLKSGIHEIVRVSKTPD